MSKAQHGNKEARKQPRLTPKEKKAAKRLKKQEGESTPLLRG
ncbi:hypothetical protein [Nitrogeniibacter mangrovi]|nr:hypothetical protein [Nitrogeniibacter mangrovi]